MLYSNDWVAEEVKYKTMAFCFYIAPSVHAKYNLDSYLRGYLLVRPFLLRLWQLHEKLPPIINLTGPEFNNDFKWTKQVMK